MRIPWNPAVSQLRLRVWNGKEVRAGKAFVEITHHDKLQAALNRAAARLRSFAAVTSGIGAGLVGASAAIVDPHSGPY